MKIKPLVSKLTSSAVLNSGFSEFDGVNYSFELSDEILSIANLQVISEKDGSGVFIKSQMGIIAYQINCLLSSISKEQFSEWQWTLSSEPTSYSFLKLRNCQISISNSENEELLPGLLEDFINRAFVSNLNQLRNRFSSIESVYQYIRSSETVDLPKLCCCELILSNKPRLENFLNRNRSGIYDSFEWDKFTYNLEKWYKADWEIQSLLDSKTQVFESASLRKKEIATVLPRFRPSY